MPYYNPSIDLNGLYTRLHLFDEELYAFAISEGLQDTRVRLDIVGSSTLMFHNIDIPVTEDIDVIKMSRYIHPDFFEKYDFNTRSTAIENYIPYNYIDRMEKLDIDTKIIDYYIISIEDAVVCKIVAGRLKDDDHLNSNNLIERINWKKIKTCAEEMKLTFVDDYHYHMFVLQYNNFVRKKKHEEAIINDI